MYKNFFGLHENPFNVNPDPRFLCLTPQIQEALEQLTYGIQNRKGLILLTGEVGTGKTTLINYLLDWLHQHKTPTAFIFNSHLNVKHLFDFILNDFGISTDFPLASNMLLQLNQWLIERFRAGSTPVLIVDEAQGLSFELLEEIRLLLNLETASQKLLQVVLVGQPELEDKLKRPELRQLRQRIALRCNTASLTLAESHGYIADRLRIAGATHQPVFESDAVEALHYYSRGIPRVMNLLCEHALINAYVEELNPVPPQMVEEAARDFLMEEFRPLATYPGMTRRMDNKLSVTHSEFARERGRSFREEAGCSLEATGAERPVAVVGFAEGERRPSAGNGMVATVPEERESAVWEEHLNTSLSVLDLVPASPEFRTQQVQSEPALNLSAAQSDCAAELVATMGRLLAAASSAPGPRPGFSKVAGEKSPALMCSQVRATENRGLSLDSMDGMLLKSGRRWMHQLYRPWKASWSSLWTRVGPAISTAMRVPAGVLRTTRGTMATARAVLRHWVLGFRHDCKVTVNAMGFPQMKKSLGQWLRQPMSSKSQSTSSTHPSQTRCAISAESRFH
jgi:type II secretory pathway predicted ATPase ExeA